MLYSCIVSSCMSSPSKEKEILKSRSLYKEFNNTIIISLKLFAILQEQGEHWVMYIGAL